MSSNANVKGSDIAPLTGVIDPDAYTAATYTTGWVSMADAERALATVMVGTLGASATVDAKIEQATDNAGAGVKDLSPAKAITQLTQAGSDSDKQVEINVISEELDVAGGFDHIRLSVTVGVATSDMAATLRSFSARYQPLADLSSVDEVVD